MRRRGKKRLDGGGEGGRVQGSSHISLEFVLLLALARLLNKIFFFFLAGLLVVETEDQNRVQVP